MDARAACWSATVSRVLAASLGWTVFAVQATFQLPELLASATVVEYFQVVVPSGHDTVTGAVAVLPETLTSPALKVGWRVARSPATEAYALATAAPDAPA
jgi:hypothetical protein